MTPDRKFCLNSNKVEEFYWAGKMVVYINNKLTDLTFDEAVKQLKEA